MNPKVILKTIILVILGMVSSMSYSQNLVVTLTNSNIESFQLEEIQSIKFETSSMVLYQFDGTTTSWDIESIDHYSFDGVTNLTEQSISIIQELIVFPNPSSDIINIKFVSNKTEFIAIDILDAKGKQIKKIYEGVHIGEKQFQWNATTRGNIAGGIYYCRISTDKKVITKPFIIQ